MHPQPLLLDQPFGVQIFLAIVLPAIFGGLCGWVLGQSETWYTVLTTLGVLGGVAAGFDHPTPKEGAVRGIIAGGLFGIFILFAAALTGDEAKAHLPEPQGVLPVATIVITIALGAIGGALRRRVERRHAASSQPAS